MTGPIEILPLRTITLEEIRPVVSGYVSSEKYAIEKSETEEQTIFNIHLVKLETPHTATFIEDFHEADIKRLNVFMRQSYSFGAYQQGRLVALAISGMDMWNDALRIWEFHVMPAFHRQGIGRALMNTVVNKAILEHVRIVFLETQNTNVSAIRFYRKMGYSLDALDLSCYSNHDVDYGEVAFYMKRMLR
jgi:streptothricin acetyltransferase